MKSNIFQVLGALVLTFTFTFVTSYAQQTLYIYSPDTKTGTTVYINTATTTGQTMPVVPTNLGTSTPMLPQQNPNPVMNVCGPLLNNFNKLGDENQSVVVLQRFLNDNFGTKLNEKGFYGPVTKAVVKRLQYTYGLPATGNQLAMTTDLINKIECGQVEVLKFKNVPAKMTYTPSVYTPPTNNTEIYNGNIPGAINQQMIEKYQAPKKDTNKMPTLEGKLQNEKVSSTSTGTAKTGDNFLEKVKENYKAYLLVFALVLALFWFLRKAATE